MTVSETSPDSQQTDRDLEAMGSRNIGEMSARSSLIPFLAFFLDAGITSINDLTELETTTPRPKKSFKMLRT